MYVDNWQTQLRKGVLDIVLLNLLSHGDSHGYEMVQRMRQIEGLAIREGNVYPILARLEQEELVEGYKQASKDGPPRKYYKLTPAGVQTLLDMNRHWEQMIASIEKVEKGEFK
ncbi:MAG: PadR family transcriptional regulator [Planctomycetaceae bacterium]|nr:PadR family transcriptional regulator [Planctomycetaceae bacterium]